MPDRVMVTKSKLDSLAEAVGSKSGLGVPLTIEGMEDAVLGIETGIQPTGTLAINKNGTHDVTKYAEANVNVRLKLQSKSVQPSTVSYQVVPDDDYDGLSQVDVDAVPIGTRGDSSITVNNDTGLITATSSLNEGYFPNSTFARTYQLSVVSQQTIKPSTVARVAVQKGKFATGDITFDAMVLQSATVASTFGNSQTVVPTSGVDGFSRITVQEVPYAEELDSAGGLNVTIG